MPFERVLQELVDRTGAQLAIFCDFEAEAIALASRGLDPYDVKVSGATYGALVFHTQRLARETGQSERVALTCITDKLALLIESLPGGYYVVLGLPPDTLWVRGRAELRKVADRFLDEL